MKIGSIAALAAVALGAQAAAAVNIVANGSFESNSFAGWTQFGVSSYTSVVSGTFNDAPTDGTHQARFGPTSGYGGISQSVGTAGNIYRLSFDLGNKQGDGAVVSFGGTTLLTDPADDNGIFHHYSYLVTTTNSLLSFSFYDQRDYYTLDNVVVSALLPHESESNVAPVPEAPVWAMFIAGFGLSGAALRRRVSAAARA